MRLFNYLAVFIVLAVPSSAFAQAVYGQGCVYGGAAGPPVQGLPPSGSLFTVLTCQSDGTWGYPSYTLQSQSATAASSCSTYPTGALRYNSNLSYPEYCNGSTWSTFGGSSILGATATSTNPSRASDLGTGLFSDTASTVSIATAGVERLRMTATGSVGIGTATPLTTLTVGSGQITTPNGAASGPAYSFSSSSNTGMWASGNDLRLTVNGNDRIRSAGGVIYTASKTMIGSINTVPLSTLDVNGGAAIGTYAGTATAPSNSLIVSGSLGVGNSSPADKLDVAGGFGLTATTATVPSVGLYSASSNAMTLATAGSNAVTITATQSLGLGTTAPKSSVDFSAKTDGLMLQTASAAAGASCTGYTGAIRYNSNLAYVEYCNGTTWSAFVATQSATPPTAPSGSGYFVLTQTTYDGNLGGISGADAKCLTELTTNTTWNGYSTANSRGLLNSSHVYSFVYSFTTGHALMPLTSYYFARVGSASAGGAFFTTDSSGIGPADSSIWSAANYFSTSSSYWSGRNSTDSTHWTNSAYNCCGNQDCSNYGSNNPGINGFSGNVGYTDYNRWIINGTYSTTTCNTMQPMICFVNP
jgi:hypothetical protein